MKVPDPNSTSIWFSDCESTLTVLSKLVLEKFDPFNFIFAPFDIITPLESFTYIVTGESDSKPKLLWEKFVPESTKKEFTLSDFFRHQIKSPEAENASTSKDFFYVEIM